MADALEQAHLSDLHAQAAELGIERFRLLRRDELIAEIESRRAEGEKGHHRRRPRLRRRERERLEAEKSGTEEPEAAEVTEVTEAADVTGVAEVTETVSGVLEVTPQRYGFIRLNGLEAGPDDVYISASQVRRCELRTGDEVSGPARGPRRGERHRALVHVDTVNGAEPVTGERPSFDDLTPVAPSRRIALDGRDDVLLRAVDLLAPLALGQRVLVAAAPRSGRTTLLRALATAIEAGDQAELIALLVDERPEEATAWREALPGTELAIAPADMAPADQVRVAELALERARRRAEAGADVVLLVDSLSRLALAARDVAVVKRLFGSGRDLAEGSAGSLTVIATVVSRADDGGDAERAVATTESALITLDRDLAAAGTVPALRVGDCAAAGEENLRDPDELAAVRRLRGLLADLPPAEAARLLRERIEGSSSNAELLGSL